MVIKLRILVVFLLLNLISFSQKDTNKICFSYYNAKLIAIDLVKGDSAVAELKVVNKLVWQLNKKINLQDSIIILYITKEKNYISQNIKYEEIIIKDENIIIGLEKDITKLNKKNNRLRSGLKFLGGGFISSILVIATLIVIK